MGPQPTDTGSNITEEPVTRPGDAASLPGEGGHLLTVPPDDAGVSGTTKPPSRRDAIVRTSIVLGVLAIVFLVILPRYIDYQEVIEAFRGLSIQDVLLVAAFGVIAWFATGAVFAALIPGLGWLRGTQAWLILAGIGASIPLGPWNMAVLWVVIRGWGLGVRETTGGIALYGIFDQLSRLAMGVVGAIVLVVAERNGTNVGVERESIIWLAVISGGVLLIALGVLIGIVRSESLARRIGAFGARLVGWVFAKLGRAGTPDVAGSVMHFRDTLGETIRDRGAAAFVI